MNDVHRRVSRTSRRASGAFRTRASSPRPRPPPSLVRSRSLASAPRPFPPAAPSPGFSSGRLRPGTSSARPPMAFPSPPFDSSDPRPSWDAFAASTARLSCDALCNAATRSSGLRASTTSFSARARSLASAATPRTGSGAPQRLGLRAGVLRRLGRRCGARATNLRGGEVPRANLTLGAELDGGVREAVSDRLAADADADVARLDEDVGTQGRLRRGARASARAAVVSR